MREAHIPSQFAPSLVFGWQSRGENASKARREELRRVANSRMAIEKRAVVEIGHEALLAATEIVAMGLVSEAARRFLNELAPLERLMPPLDFRSIEETLIGTPIVGRYGERAEVFEPLTVALVSPPLSKMEEPQAESRWRPSRTFRDAGLSRNRGAPGRAAVTNRRKQ
jgi:hypothetical protein